MGGERWEGRDGKAGMRRDRLEGMEKLRDGKAEMGREGWEGRDGMNGKGGMGRQGMGWDE